MAVYMLMNFDADWDEWKPVFDSDPAGRKQIAEGTQHRSGRRQPERHLPSNRVRLGRRCQGLSRNGCLRQASSTGSRSRPGQRS